MPSVITSLTTTTPASAWPLSIALVLVTSLVPTAPLEMPHVRICNASMKASVLESCLDSPRPLRSVTALTLAKRIKAAAGGPMTAPESASCMRLVNPWILAPAARRAKSCVVSSVANVLFQFLI